MMGFIGDRQESFRVPSLRSADKLRLAAGSSGYEPAISVTVQPVLTGPELELESWALRRLPLAEEEVVAEHHGMLESALRASPEASKAPRVLPAPGPADQHVPGCMGLGCRLRSS